MKVFALQNGGWCAAADNKDSFNKYGPSTACGADGEGGPKANHVYEICGSSQPSTTVAATTMGSFVRGLPIVRGLPGTSISFELYNLLLQFLSG